MKATRRGRSGRLTRSRACQGAGNVAGAEMRRAEERSEPGDERVARPSEAQAPVHAEGEIARMLSLQRGAGNAAVSRMVLARQVPPVAPPAPAAVHHTQAEIDAMTLSDFDAYATDQADWATEPNRPAADSPMPADHVRKLRRLLEFAREAGGGSQPILAGCGGMTVSDLLATNLDGAVRDELRHYGQAVAQTTVTVQLGPVSDVARAREYGRALKKLEVTPGHGVAHTIFKQTEGADQLGELIDSGHLDDFVAYCRGCHPLLEADNGAEIRSYLALRTEGADPRDYRGRIPDVRNFHRFEKALLDALALNRRHTAKDKPLYLILHSAFDHNGAFHRDPNLTAVFTDNSHLTLMIEGKTSLAEVASELGPLARRYGQGNKIQQVMIAGHGNAQVIQLAGTMDTAQLDAGGTNTDAEQDDAVSSHTGSTAHTDAFMRELLRNMANDPNARIVLNGCLTASNSVNAPLDGDPAKAAQQVHDAIQAEPSLATYLGAAAATAGNQAQVRGANASFGQVGLMDASGNLDIVPGARAPDPLLTAAKVDYIRGGNEPQGCMRAVLEVWAQDRLASPQTTAARDAVQARLRDPDSTAWDQRIIRTLYGIADANWDNAELIRQLGDAGGDLSELKFERSCRVSALNSVPAAHVATIFTGLTTAAWWTTTPRLPLVVHQKWMQSDASKEAEFMTTLGNAAFTCRVAQRFVDFTGPIATHLGALLPAGHGPTASRAELILSLLGVETDEAAPEPTSKAFLIAAWGAGPTFPAAMGVEALLDGLSTAQSVERAIGVRAPLGGGGGAGAPVLNVDLDRDGVNDFHVDPITRRGLVTATRLNVRERPGMGETVVGGLDQGRQVEAIGTSGDWYAIEFNGGAAFVHHDWVTLRQQL